MNHESFSGTLGLFLDFSKAFDIVNHDILLTKLEYLGIRGIPLEWFKSYLADRRQYVIYNDIKSSCKTITCGVPQGSILGPLLFLLYKNDLANVSDVIFSLFFADDSNMFLSGKNPDDLIKLMNTEITKVIEWLRINKLSLNLKKTHFMVFRKSLRKKELKEDVIIDNVKIDFVTQTKFLGVILDQHLTFESHTCAIHQRKDCKGHWYFVQSKKVSQRKLNENTLLCFYISIFHLLCYSLGQHFQLSPRASDLRYWSRSGGSYGNNTRVICWPAPGRPESAARGTSPPDNKSRVLSILCTTIVCVVPTVYWCVYMKLCLHGLVYLGWIMDYVPFLIFLLYLYMYLLCDNKRFWTLNFEKMLAAWHIVNWTLGNTCQWNLNQNLSIFIPEN